MFEVELLTYLLYGLILYYTLRMLLLNVLLFLVGK